jgi:hypothetical protein
VIITFPPQHGDQPHPIGKLGGRATQAGLTSIEPANYPSEVDTKEAIRAGDADYGALIVERQPQTVGLETHEVVLEETES